jgi:hypothetical protein
MKRRALNIILYLGTMLVLVNFLAALADELVLKKLHSIDKFLTTQASSPTFHDKRLARTIFSDLSSFMRTIQYHPLRGWAYKEFHSATFNTDTNGYRTNGGFSGGDKGEIWLFGGSTLMGWGASDDMTISSWLQRLKPEYSIRSFAQMGYTSTQELIQFMELLSLDPNAKPRAVIFFDGKNEFWAGRSGLQSQNTVYGHEIRSLFQEGKTTAVGNSFYPFVSFMIDPVRKMILRARYGLYLHPGAEQSLYSEKGNHGDLVCKTMLQNWRVAKALTEERGGRFVGILHPNAALSKARTDYIDPELFRHFPYVDAYRNAAQTLAAMHLPWAIDLTSAYDHAGNEYIFLDDTHLTSRGGEIMAGILSERIDAMLDGNREL